MKEQEHFDSAFKEVTRNKAGITERIRKFPNNPSVRYMSSALLLEGLGGGMFYLGVSTADPIFYLGGVSSGGVGTVLIGGEIANKVLDTVGSAYKEAFSVAISKAFKTYRSEQKDPLSREELEAFLKKIFYLPPVGGKVTLEKNSLSPAPLSPALTADEKVEEIIKFRQEGRLDSAYVHQLTVQGKLPDEFKYAALALIINSTYRSDWNKPFYEADWAKVAPLIHGGGRVRDINPLWRYRGRTDFLQRVAMVHEPELENMEQYATPQLATQFSPEDLANAVLEQEEKRRLILEINFYQRAAFALHAKIGTLPNAVPPDVARKGMREWESFVKDMDSILNNYDASRVTKQRWLTRLPRLRPWALRPWGGLRYEANYSPIRETLTFLEEVKSNNPSFRREVNALMIKTTSSIDNAIGI